VPEAAGDPVKNSCDGLTHTKAALQAHTLQQAEARARQTEGDASTIINVLEYDAANRGDSEA
jgi:hypothetical protein